MRVGLAQVDGKWPNLALMRLSAWHKQQGDETELFTPLRQYDRVYASKVFDFTPDDPYLPEGTIYGGTGYDVGSRLDAEIEGCFPDYSLYPEWESAIGFTTRGCVNACSFCLVPRKEGRLRVVGDLYSFWNGQSAVVLLDNNLTAAPMEHFRRVVGQLVEHKVRVDFSQGLDLRLLNDEHSALLSKVRLLKRVHFAWDNPADEKEVEEGLRVFGKHNSLHNAMVYVLIGYSTTPEEDLYRVEKLRSLNVDPFVMPYCRSDGYQRRFARWVNHKAIFKSVPWAEYKAG